MGDLGDVVCGIEGEMLVAPKDELAILKSSLLEVRTISSSASTAVVEPTGACGSDGSGVMALAAGSSGNIPSSFAGVD